MGCGFVKDYIMQKISIHKRMADAIDIDSIENISNIIAECYANNGKLLILGNGGSAADAMHMAAEFEQQLTKKDKRRALPAIVPFNLSSLTAASNDIGYDTSFQRFVESNAVKGDIVIAISTSGNSKNILVAAEKARERGCKIIGLTGGDGGKLKSMADACFMSPADEVSTIQEGHIIAYHIICGLVIRKLFGHDPL